MDTVKIKSITQLHANLGFESPKHPLIAIIDFSTFQACGTESVSISADFYSILFKKPCPATVKYGWRDYDFKQGTLLFFAPNQVLNIEAEPETEADNHAPNGWGLYFHQDLLRTYPIINQMKSYNFFEYSLFEGLHISDDEKIVLEDILKKIEREFTNNIDKHTEKLIVSNLELLLNYCQRFYDRQFIMRSKFEKRNITKFEKLLNEYFNDLDNTNLPSVQGIAKELNMSPKYLSSFLKSETGMSAQQHIHYQMIEVAKNRLHDPELKSISEVAFSLGFEHPPYFTKIFKKKVGLTPSEYRKRIINN